MSRVSNREGGTGMARYTPFAAFFEAFHNDHLVGNIHPSGCDVEGFRNSAPRVIQEAAQGAHGPIVPQGGAEERLALPRREVEASAKGIIEIGCVMHAATGYKCSVAIARHGAGRGLRTSCDSASMPSMSESQLSAPVWGNLHRWCVLLVRPCALPGAARPSRPWRCTA